MKPLRRKQLKRKIRKFWREWGISKEELVDFLSCLGLLALIFEFYIIGILL